MREMNTIPTNNNEETQTGLTRRREAHEEDQAPVRPNVEDISEIVVDAAFRLHRDLGPGLLESVYEAILAKPLPTRVLERQNPFE